MQTADLYQTYFSEIQRYLRRFLSDAQAEDLAQEVFIKADRGLKQFRGDASPRTWLYRIATNALRDDLRSKHRRIDETTIPIPTDELDRYQDANCSDCTIEQEVIRDEMNSCIREFIQRLPEHYSMVLVLSDLEGHTNQEVADILSISLATAKIRLHRARARLKAELSQKCDLSFDRNNTLVCQPKDQ